MPPPRERRVFNGRRRRVRHGPNRVAVQLAQLGFLLESARHVGPHRDVEPVREAQVDISRILPFGQVRPPRHVQGGHRGDVSAANVPALHAGAQLRRPYRLN